MIDKVLIKCPDVNDIPLLVKLFKKLGIRWVDGKEFTTYYSNWDNKEHTVYAINKNKLSYSDDVYFAGETFKDYTCYSVDAFIKKYNKDLIVLPRKEYEALIKELETYRLKYPKTEPAYGYKKIDGEIWKPVAGFEKYYEVSSKGRVRNKRGRILSKYIVGKGRTKHYYVHLRNNYCPKVSFLVAEAFLPRADKYTLDVIHKGEMLDDSLENIEWSQATDTIIRFGRRVLQYSFDGERLLAEHYSVLMAARSLDVDPSAIFSVLTGKTKTSYGYVWKWKD